MGGRRWSLKVNLQFGLCQPWTSVQGQSRENALSSNDRALSLLSMPNQRAHFSYPRLQPDAARVFNPIAPNFLHPSQEIGDVGAPGVWWFRESLHKQQSFLFRRLKLSGADVLLRSIVRWKLALGMQRFEEAHQRRNFCR
jgi:hypothetical protein